VNRDTNLAAWMIGGGPRSVDPSEARAVIHRRALADARRQGPARIGRIIAAFRPKPAPTTSACCPA
jgi:hypothetical protein